MKDGEVLGSGYKVEVVGGEETLVPDNDSILEGIAQAVERAVRVQKVAPVFKRLKTTGWLFELPPPANYRTTDLSN